MEKQDIEAILARVRAGDTEAYSEIVRRHQHEVWKIVAAMLKDISTTEELVQKTFINGYFHLDQYRPNSGFGPWIRMIARNLVRMELRTRLRQDRRMKTYYEQLLASPDRDTRSGEEDEDRAKILEECKRRLPPKCAELLELRYSRSLSFEDLARRFGRSVEATRQMLSRIRLMLRDCVESELSET